MNSSCLGRNRPWKIPQVCLLRVDQTTQEIQPQKWRYKIVEACMGRSVSW